MSMTEEELIEAYNTATAEVFEALDAAHVALVQLQSVKREISNQAVALGLVGIAGRDGAGKNQAKRIEAAAVIRVENVSTIHGHLQSARTLLIGSSPDLGALGEAGMVVYNWQDEFNGIVPVER